uniref:NADH dehydrogenase [ubiquinone] 1 alpha subcomplex subunit 6 n=1 Tax=Rhabditophanes sp. KR3021 TaxID=114890 RepID=A0AC35TVB7_9BILA
MSASRISKLGATTTTKLVAPVISSNSIEARRRVLTVYKELQRLAPKFWFDYGLQDAPLSVFREVLKNQFTKNKHVQDIRVVDRMVEETKQHIVNIRYAFYNPDHVRNMLFRENVEPKSKDFLSNFFSGKQ